MTEEKLVNKELYYRNNGIPQKKAMTYTKFTDDFHFNVSYGNLDHLSEQQTRWAGKQDSTFTFSFSFTEVLDTLVIRFARSRDVLSSSRSFTIQFLYCDVISSLCLFDSTASTADLHNFPALVSLVLYH